MSSYIPQIPEVAVNKFLNDMQYNFDQLSTEYTAIKKKDSLHSMSSLNASVKEVWLNLLSFKSKFNQLSQLDDPRVPELEKRYTLILKKIEILKNLTQSDICKAINHSNETDISSKEMKETEDFDNVLAQFDEKCNIENEPKQIKSAKKKSKLKTRAKKTAAQFPRAKDLTQNVSHSSSSPAPALINAPSMESLRPIVEAARTMDIFISDDPDLKIPQSIDLPHGITCMFPDHCLDGLEGRYHPEDHEIPFNLVEAILRQYIVENIEWTKVGKKVKVGDRQLFYIFCENLDAQNDIRLAKFVIAKDGDHNIALITAFYRSNAYAEEILIANERPMIRYKIDRELAELLRVADLQEDLLL